MLEPIQIRLVLATHRAVELAIAPSIMVPTKLAMSHHFLRQYEMACQIRASSQLEVCQSRVNESSLPRRRVDSMSMSSSSEGSSSCVATLDEAAAEFQAPWQGSPC
eukprot:2291870-Rhodomonas_salina.1